MEIVAAAERHRTLLRITAWTRWSYLIALAAIVFLIGVRLVTSDLDGSVPAHVLIPIACVAATSLVVLRFKLPFIDRGRDESGERSEIGDGRTAVSTSLTVAAVLVQTLATLTWCLAAASTSAVAVVIVIALISEGISALILMPGKQPVEAGENEVRRSSQPSELSASAGAAAIDEPEGPVVQPNTPAGAWFDDQNSLANDECIPDSLMQQYTRLRDESGAETITGLVREPIVVEQRTVISHVSFCPPLTTRPEISVELVDGPEATVKVSHAETYGARFELRLARPANEPGHVIYEFVTQSPDSAPSSTEETKAN